MRIFEDAITKGKYFCFSVDLMEIHENNQWLIVLENLNQENVVIHKIETYWDGGNKTLWDKREFFLTLSQERPESDELFDSDPLAPLCLAHNGSIDPRINEIKAWKTNQDGLVGPEDLGVISTFPLSFGLSVMEPYLSVGKGEVLYLGGHSKEIGKVSLIVKGWVQDAIKEQGNGITDPSAIEID